MLSVRQGRIMCEVYHGEEHLALPDAVCLRISGIGSFCTGRQPSAKSNFNLCKDWCER